MEWLLLTIPGKRVSADLEDRAYGKRRKIGLFVLSPFIVQWRLEMQSCFSRESFRALMFLPKWVFFVWEASWGKVLTLD